MKPSVLLASCCLLLASFTVHASWYWPFGEDVDEAAISNMVANAYAEQNGEDGKKKPPRVSELIEPATTNMDAAADYAAEGNTQKAIESYRAALAALDKIEQENPERAASPEFATIRTKRAIVNANIDAILLAEAKRNARAVSVTDTTDLEKRIAERQSPDKPKQEKQSLDKPKLEKQIDKYMKVERKHNKKVQKAAANSRSERLIKNEIKRLLKEDPRSRKARMLQANEHLRKGEVAEAKSLADKLLEEKANDAAALNLRAACEMAEGDLKAAEKTLDTAIMSHPRKHHAYYNMANLYLEKGNVDGARRYYESGRLYGGPKDATIEKAVKRK